MGVQTALLLMGWTGCFPRAAVGLDCCASTGEEQPMDTTIAPLASIGIDIGKEVFLTARLRSVARLSGWPLLRHAKRPQQSCRGDADH
jgi:hypothetical protein